ncbi:MAG TPA: protein-L-isoaspartate(D-aspartate) O-methyltransferase [Spirochaetota bacterium]
MKRIHFILISMMIAASGISGWAFESTPAMKDQLAKKVQHYRETAKFSESVLQALSKVPRDFYVPADKRARTYEEASLPIGYGQTITNMWFVAYMTNLLEVKPTDKVLEIGSGSGYQASVLSQITKTVFSIEIVEPLAKAAANRWKEMGFVTIKGKAADGYFGWAENAPFDKIVVTCAADHVPTYLLQQLKPGGIMVIPVGNPFDRQTLLLIRKKDDGKIITQRLNSCKFVPFTGKMLEKYGKK